MPPVPRINTSKAIFTFLKAHTIAYLFFLQKGEFKKLKP
jgi:hypothetical protein